METLKVLVEYPINNHTFWFRRDPI